MNFAGNACPKGNLFSKIEVFESTKPQAKGESRPREGIACLKNCQISFRGFLVLVADVNEREAAGSAFASPALARLLFQAPQNAVYAECDVDRS
jgi:hypothetical protein